MNIPLLYKDRRRNMKRKSLLLTVGATLLSLGCLSGCNLSNELIVVWVGSESVTYYRKVAKQFLADNPGFGYQISIVGADTGSAAGEMQKDNTACGDIITIAHDNIGKLSQASYIAPIIDKELLKQIDDDNPEGFKSVIKNSLGNDDEHQYTFAVPYISQALFLYYDTRYVSDEQADTFESLFEAAKAYDANTGASGTKAVTVTSTDGFNFSFTLLARNLTNGNTSSLRLYENANQKDCYNQSNENVAIMKWAQRATANPNGLMLESKSTWESDIETHKALSVIGGAWHYNSFKDAVGEENMGCKIIPTFTLTDDDVADIEAVNYPNDESLPEELRGKVDPAPVAGTVYRGGSFVDCKCFVINMNAITDTSDAEGKYNKICQVLKYFSSKDVQNQSFIEALNVPAYAGADEFIEANKDKVAKTAYLMATAQTGMSIYGIPQPFINGTLNTNYYSKGTPDQYKNCIFKRNSTGLDVQGIRKVLWNMEYVWKRSTNAAAAPDTLPYETTHKYPA